MVKCATLRSGNIETNPWPFAESSDGEELLQETVANPSERDPILSELERVKELINDDGEVINILVGKNETVELARFGRRTR